jgi:iron complex outermembrane receptor protein
MLQKRSLLFFSLILCIANWQTGFSQEKKHCFKGFVNDFHDHNGIPFASIYVEELKTSILTDSSGSFEICNWRDGIITLIIKQLGYNTLKLKLEPGKKKIHFHLKENNQWLDAIDVRGEHGHFESEVVESQSLHQEDLLARKGESLGEMVSKIPGVQFLQTGPSIFKPIIQGLGNQRIAIINQGIKLEGQQWGNEHAPEIDPNQADEITVVKGAQSVRFGAEALGGAILLEPGKIETEGKLQLRSGSAFSSNGRGTFQNLMLQKSFFNSILESFRISGTYKRSGNFSTACYHLGNTAMEESGAQILVRLKKGKWKAETSGDLFFSHLGIFSGSHISTPEGIRNSINRPDSSYKYPFSFQIGRPSQKILHLTGRAKVEFQATESRKYLLTYNQQLDRRQEFDIIRRFASCQTCPQLSFELFSSQLEISQKIQKEKAEIQTGVVGLLQSNNTSGSKLIPDFLIQQLAFYHIHSLFFNRWTFEAGIRGEFRHQQVFQYPFQEKVISLKRFWNGMGNIGFRYQMDDHWHTKGNLQFTSRAPSMNESYSNGVHHGTASFEQGSQEMKPEQILNFTYSLHHRSEKWEALIILFETYSPNFIYLSPVPDSIIYTIRGPFPFFKYNSSEVNIRGLDFFLDFKAWEFLSIYSKGSISRAWNLSGKTWLIFQPADRLELGLSWKSEKNKTGFQWHGRVGPVFVDKQWRVPAERDFAPPPPPYVLWNAQIGFSGFWKTHLFDFSIEGQNLSNTAYRDYLNRFRYFALDMGQNFRFRFTFFLHSKSQFP